MKYLLDTHVFLWAEADPSRLAPEALAVLQDPDSRLYLSAVVAWEVSIKFRLGKLTLPMPPLPFLLRAITRESLVPLPVTLVHAASAAWLPDIHADPFDRLLVAQAQVEDLVVVTRDERIRRYPVSSLAA